MKVKIYLNEWFVNAGIIGFLRIMEHSNNTGIEIRDNYIELDTNILNEFNKYYFKYFFDKYNVADKMKDRISSSFGKIKILIEVESKEKEIQEKLKSEKKYIKQVLKGQLDKIKKIDEQIYDLLQKDYELIDKIKTKEDLEKLQRIQEEFIDNFYKDNINKKITLNLFKNILSNNYFGQPSFFNVGKNSLTYEEQENLMYKDYISNIIESGILQDIIEKKYKQDVLKELLREKQKDNMVSKEFKNIYSNIDKKYVQKNKSIEEIKEYLESKVICTCSMCGKSHILTSLYTESNFIPLAVSSENMSNFFWNQNTKFPICELCKLILFCIPAGVTSIRKVVKEDSSYTEKEVFSFVNYDADINTLLRTNNNFANNSKKEKMNYNPYEELILSIVEQDRKISEWQLQNIFVVEFEAEYLAFSRLQYFNIKRYVAKLFKNYSYLLNNIKDYKYKLEIIDNILKDKKLITIINNKLRSQINQKVIYGEASYLATKIEYTLKILKREDIDVNEEIKRSNGKTYELYQIGKQIHNKLKKDNNENKLDGYIYKMLNCIKTNNKNDFIDIAIRVMWSQGKDIPETLVKKDEFVDWQELGHSFIAGLTSNSELEENEEVNKNE